MSQAKQNIYGLSLCLALSALVLSTIFAPRSLGLTPAILGLLFTGLYSFIYKSRPPLFFPALLIGVGIIALAGLSGFWAAHPDIAWERTGKIAMIILPSLLLVGVLRGVPLDNVRPYIRFITISYALLLVFLVIELLFDYPFFRLTHQVPDDQHVGHHELNRAVVCAIMMLLPVSALASNFFKGKQWLAMVFFTVLALPFLVVTDSQSAQMAILVMFAFFFLFPYGSRAAWFALMAVFVVGILGAPFIATYGFSHYAAILHALPGMGAGGAHVGNRMEVWDFISRYALQRPITGFGIDITKTVENFDSKQIYQRGTTILHPHNFFLQVWIEFGAIGAVLLSATLIYILNSIRTKFTKPGARIALSCLMGLVCVGLTAYGMWQAWWVGLILLVTAFIFLATRLLDQEPVSG